jgi:hypothetical protein
MKVQFVPADPVTAFAMSGHVDFPKVLPNVTLRQWAASKTYHFQSLPVVERAIKSTAASELTDKLVKTVANHLANELTSFFAGNPAAGVPLRGKWLSKLFLVQSNDTGLRMGVASLSVDGAGVVRVTTAEAAPPIGQDDLFEPHASTDYVQNNVLDGIGRHFLPSEFSGTLGGRKVRDVTAGDAVRYVRALVRATELTTQLIPFGDDIGIGGAVRGYLVKRDSAVPLEDIR